MPLNGVAPAQPRGAAPARGVEGKGLDKVELTADQRALLGLGADDSIRLLEARRRTILLERIQSSSSTALPWDRDLVLSADVRSFPLADILHLLHSSNHSGFLLFEDAEHEKSVYLHRGEVVFASSNQSFDRLGNCLLRSGAITAEQFEEANSAYRTPGHFGKVLVERGFLTPRELWNGVNTQVEEIVRSLFSYGSGTVLFWEGEVRPNNVVRLSLPTRRLIAEGLRRRDELIKFLAMLEDPRVRLQASPGAERNLSGTERLLFDVIGRLSSFGDVCREAGVEPLAAARTIRHLRLHGAVSILRATADEPGGPHAEKPEQESDSIRECITEHLKVIAELVMPIVAVESAESIAERIRSVIDEAAEHYPELLANLHVGRGGAIDPEELIARARRFPGEREREIRLALGELISYLEFEMLNHPGIPDPEDYLEGIAALRARL
jgi:hypothetical protein